MEQANLFYRFGAALAIGFLVGLQREYAYGGPDREIFAGIRTFALMSMIGCTAALVSEILDTPWAFVSIFAILGLLIAIAHSIDAWRGGVGQTTEVSAIVTILAGALCYWEYLPLAAALSVATTVLLSLKFETERFVEKITREDIYATLKFAVITVIILPVLPNQNFGPPPLDILNPYKVWLMVVFISGISFLGYVLVKAVGPRQGIGLTGLLGGLASSTAVTLSFSERSQRESDLAKPFALAIIVAWTVMFARVLVTVGALNGDLLRKLWLPLLACGLSGLGYCIYLYLVQRTTKGGGVEISNPFELGPTIKFGILYALVLLISKAAQTYLGNTGLYISSFFAGLAGMDAITLSVIELSNAGNINVTMATRVILLAAMANTIAKGGVVFTSGSPGLRRALWPGLLLILATGTSFIFTL